MEGKKRFEVKFQKVGNKTVKAVFVDDVMLDYSVDVEKLKEISALGFEYRKAALLDIEKHFVDCVSEMVGRHVTYQEVLNAFKTGWI